MGYYCLSGFNQVADLLVARPGQVRILIGRIDTSTREEIAAGYNPRESASGYYAGQNRRDENAARDATMDNVGRNAVAQGPTGLSVETTTRTGVALSWDAVAVAAKYKLTSNSGTVTNNARMPLLQSLDLKLPSCSAPRWQMAVE